MKTAILMVSFVATLLLTGCQGFMGLDYQNKKYLVGSNHDVKGAYLAGIAQNDGEYSIVVGKRNDEYKAWVERDGEYVHINAEPWRLFVNPWWPFPYRKAVKRGTPSELGLYDEIGHKQEHCLFLSIEVRHRIVSRYSACVAMWGKDSVQIATNDKLFGSKRYWLEVTVDGKRYAQPMEGVYRQHFVNSNPYGTGFVEQWRGSLDEYDVLSNTMPYNPARAQVASQSLDPLKSWYWLNPGRHTWKLFQIDNN